MANDWIIDVIVDLRDYAAKNGLPELSKQLDQAMLVAVTEVTSRDMGVRRGADITYIGAGNPDRKLGKSAER